MKNYFLATKIQYHPLKRKIGLQELLFGFSDICMFAFFCSALLYYFVDYRFSQVRIIILLISGLMAYISWIIRRKIEKRIVFYIICAIVTFLLTLLFQANYNYSVSQFLLSLAYMGIGINLADHKHKSLPYVFLCYITDVIIIIKILFIKVPINSLIQDGSSYNYISITALLYFLVASIIRVSEGKKISILQTVLFLFVVILGYGRGGLVAGLVLIVGLIWISTVGKRNIYRIILIGGIIICLVLVIVFWDNIILFLINNTRILGKFADRGLASEARIEYWWTFIKNNTTSVKNLIFGSDPYLVRKIDGNLHNSFLQMYSAYGLAFLIINIIFIIDSYKSFVGTKRVYLILLFSILLIRAFFDRAFFHGVNECIYYYFLFIPVFDNNKNIQTLYGQHLKEI